MFGSKTTTVQVKGMTCHHCEMSISKALMKVPNVKSAEANANAGSVTIRHSERLDMTLVKAAVEKAGYSIIESAS
jgi:copper chaperone